jgi:glycosyltransferase involved in cell wall biosynthesis
VDGITGILKDVGLLFENGNAEDLANKIKMLENKSLYDEITSQCKQASQQYDITKVAKKYIELYQLLKNEN